MGPSKDKRDVTELGIHGGIGGAVFGCDDGIGKLDGETGGDDGVGWIGQVICIYPYAPLDSREMNLGSTPFPEKFVDLSD